MDELDRNTLTDMSKVCKQYIKQGRWGEAAGMFNKMINYFTTRTGLNFVYNYLLQGQPAPFSYYPKYLRLPKTRLAKKTYRLINKFCLGLTCLLLTISNQEGHSCWKQGLQWCEWKGLRLPAEGHPQDCQAMAGDPTGCQLQSSHLQVNLHTILQYMMNAKLSKQRFWHCFENRLIKTIQTIPHNLYWGLG